MVALRLTLASSAASPSAFRVTNRVTRLHRVGAPQSCSPWVAGIADSVGRGAIAPGKRRARGLSAAAPVGSAAPGSARPGPHPPVQPLRVRLRCNPQPSADRGPGLPEPGGVGLESRAAGPSRPGRCRSLRCCRPAAHQLDRQRIWVAEQSEQRARPQGHGQVVRPDAPHGAGTAIPERTQHTLTPRARHVPGEQGLLGPIEAHHDDHSARLHS